MLKVIKNLQGKTSIFIKLFLNKHLKLLENMVYKPLSWGSLTKLLGWNILLACFQ